MHTHQLEFVENGKRHAADRVLVLLHGRGSTGRGILGLQDYLEITNAWVIAPQASQNTWYPYSFMNAVEDNEPALGSALTMLDELFDFIKKEGFINNQVYIVGFSQGACLALEYIATRGGAYGGVVAFTGGLIGKSLQEGRYTESLENTPVLICTGDHDPHVPLIRVEETRQHLIKQHAKVQIEVYPDKPHSISADELLLANQTIFNFK